MVGVTLDAPSDRRKLAFMRFLFCLLLLSGAALADPCAESPRPFWSLACTNPLTRAITLEMESLITDIRQTPGLHPGTWAAHGLRAEMIYRQLDLCRTEQESQACIRSVSAGYIAELWESPHLPDDYSGLSRAPVDLLCPDFARPFRLTRFDTQPTAIWIAPGYALLARDHAARNVVFGGQGAEGSVDLAITPSGQIVLTGLTDRPMPCMIADEGVLN